MKCKGNYLFQYNSTVTQCILGISTKGSCEHRNCFFIVIRVYYSDKQLQMKTNNRMQSLQQLSLHCLL